MVSRERMNIMILWYLQQQGNKFSSAAVVVNPSASSI
jgi:hypothetical protein